MMNCFHWRRRDMHQQIPSKRLKQIKTALERYLERFDSEFMKKGEDDE